jgi:serine/threonine protein kinase/predicted negative regulator of RcsB-dependent stress response
MDSQDTQNFSGANSASLVGCTVGRFAIHERIGSGGMGEVYRAEDTKLRRTVAIKRISPKFRQNPTYRARLVKEARHASSLNDPHIAAVYDVFDDGEEYFLVMEFIEGKSLRHYVDGTITAEDFIGIATQCIQALAVAHRGGVIHRDVKPENVMINRGRQVKICDFGLARLMPMQDGIVQATVTEGIAGTPGYMAPEVHLGSLQDPRSDVFSLGLVLYELWTGRRPFSNDVFLQSASSVPIAPSPAQVRPGLPPQFDTAIQRMLSFSPADRYSDAAALLEELRALETANRTKRFRFTRERAAMLFLACVVLTIFAWYSFRRVDTAPKEVPSIILGDFQNDSGNTYFDFTVSQLFALSMEQSQYLNVLSRYRISEALARARKPAADAVTRQLALELAKAEGVKFVVTGDVQKKGSGVEILVHATDANAGKEVNLLRAGLTGPEELPRVVQELASQTRAWFGESRAQINATNIPVDQATTRSAIAWERFSRANRMEALGKLEDEVNLLRSAIQIDSDFAMAYAQLGIALTTIGNLQDGLASTTHAYELKDRVTERERYNIIGSYHSLRYELEAAADAYRTLSNLYPYYDLGHRYYSQASLNMLRVNEAISAAEKAVQLNPNSGFNRGTLTFALVLANRYDDVILMMDKNSSPRLNVSVGEAWLGKDDFRRAEQAFQELAAVGGSWYNTGRLQIAKTLIYEGRLDEAASQLEADLANDAQMRDTRLAVQRRNWLAWIRALQGNRASASNYARSLLEVATSPVNLRELRGAAVMLAGIRDVSLAQRVLERLESFAKSFQGNSFQGAVAQIRGEIARAQGNKDAARQNLEQAGLLWRDALMIWSLAQFAEETGDFERARTLYDEVLNRKGEIIHSHYPALKSLALAGAARCEARLGNFEQSARRYDEFLSTMGTFSPELSAVKAARLERERLVARTGQ